MPRLGNASQITNAYIAAQNLSEFLRACEAILGFHMTVLDENLQDPSITEPPEFGRWYGEVEPYKPLIVNNMVRAYLATEKDNPKTGKLEEELDLICAFLQKMPELNVQLSYRDEAYIAGISELLFSRDNERMISLRAQIGLSGLNREDGKAKYVIINIKNKDSTESIPQLEYTLRHHYVQEQDIVLRQQNTLILFKRVPKDDFKKRKFAQKLEEILTSFPVIACVSDYFSDPVRDFRMRQLFNCNEQVLQYLLSAYHDGASVPVLAFFDEWRMVSLVYAALSCPGVSIYGGQLYISEKVKEIIEYDQKNQTDYLPTLYRYINCNFSLNETAEYLHIHRNTVVYRVKRMRELFNIDFDDANECFRLNLSSRLHRIALCYAESNITPE